MLCKRQQISHGVQLQSELCVCNDVIRLCMREMGRLSENIMAMFGVKHSSDQHSSAKDSAKQEVWQLEENIKTLFGVKPSSDEQQSSVKDSALPSAPVGMLTVHWLPSHRSLFLYFISELKFTTTSVYLLYCILA